MTKSRPRPILDGQADKKLRIRRRRVATRIVVEVGVSIAGDERMLDRFARWFQIRYHRFREPMAGIDRLSARESCQCQVSRSCGLVIGLGYALDRKRGSHLIYRHSWRRDLPLVNLQEGQSGKAKPYQVRQVLGLIDAFNLKVQ
jgi:hypothetical protein